MKKLTVNFYSDPGHGWAKVSIEALKKLGIADKISSYSYYRNGFGFLEEDCDFSLLVNACKALGVKFAYKELKAEKSSKIRSYVHYSKKLFSTVEVA